MKKFGLLLLLGGMAIVVLGFSGGLVLAQTPSPDPGTTPQQETTREAFGYRGFHGRSGWAGRGQYSDNTAWLENLAKALGIPVDRLTTAQDTARATMLADAVAAGQITQEQADLMVARQALRPYINHKSIMASVLDMSLEDLDAALAGGSTVSELITAKGIDAEALQLKAQATFESALKQAVVDGAITQAQADTLLSNGANLLNRGGFMGDCDGLGRWNGDSFQGGSDGNRGNRNGGQGRGFNRGSGL